MLGGQKDVKEKEFSMLWVLNLSDGRNTLLDISDKSGLRFDLIKDAAEALLACGLLKEDIGKVAFSQDYY